MKFQWLLFSLLEAAFLRSDTRKVLTRTVARSDLRMHHSRDILRRTHEAQEAAYNARIHTNGAMVQKGQHAGGTLRTHAGKNGTSEEKYVLTGCYHVDKESLYPELPPYDGEDGALTLETCYYYCVEHRSIWFLVSKGNECICADLFDGEDADSCESTCEGSDEKCGGSDSSTAYLLTSWVPKIEKLPCGSPPAIPNTASMCSGGGGEDLPSTCNVTCATGFIMKENALLCDSSTGEWFGHAFCAEILCGLPQPIPNMMSICNGASALKPDCEVTCLPGHNLITNTLKCEQASPESGQGFFGGEAICEPVNCGLPPAMEYALYNGEHKALFPSMTEYACMKGFTTDGTPSGPTSFVINCQEDGSFTALPASCMPIECGMPPLVEKAMTTASEVLNFASVTEYVCDDGYYVGGLPTGPKSIFLDCTATGEFAPYEPCEPVICGPPPQFPFASTTADPTVLLKLSEPAQYSCDAGYSTDPNDKSKNAFVATCGTVGEFEGVAACVPIKCPKAGPVDHALVADGELVYLSIADYMCDEGHSIDGTVEGNRSFLVECLSDGTLAPPGECLPIACPPPPSAPNRKLTTDAPHEFGNSVTYTCDEGFSTDATEATGAKIIVSACLASGEYAETAPCIGIDDCAGHSCGPAGTCIDEHMAYHCECESGFEVVMDDYGEPTCGNIDDCGDCGVGTCEDLINDFTCHCPEGYELVTDPEKTCGPVLCGDPPHLALSTRPDGKAFFTDTIPYACDIGTSIDGTPEGPVSFIVGCGSTKSFTDEKECKKMACPPPPFVPFGEPDVPSSVFNETIKYSCATGHTVDGSAEGETKFDITCLAGGQYSAPMECMPVECGSPPPVVSGVVDETPLFFEQTATYMCAEGHSTDGTADEAALSFTIECGASGTVEGVKECIPILCEAPPSKPKSFRSVTEPLPYPLAVEYLCDEGYTIDGELMGSNKFYMSCGADGSLVGDVETECQPVSCGVIEVMEAKPSTPDPIAFPTEVTYTCNEGFAMEATPSDVELISPEGAETSFSLTCQANGELTPPPACKNIDDCHGHSCGAHGTCVDQIGDYTCDCQDGFELNVKDNGEKVCGNIDDCKDSQCGEYGVCIDFTGGYTCQCVQGYELEELEDGKHKTCSAVVCGTIEPIEHSTQAEPITLAFPETHLFVCENGYSTDGTVAPEGREFTVACQPTGELTPPSMCNPVVCGVVPAITMSHTEVDPLEAQVYGNKIDYSCEDGYSLTGTPSGETSFSIECTMEGLFTEHLGCMPKNCGLPPTVEMASTGGEVIYPGVALFECATGFSLDGTAGNRVFELPCQSDGSFAPLPELKDGGCQPIECPAPPQVGNAMFEERPKVVAGESVVYRCAEGHTTTGTMSGLAEFAVMCQDSGDYTPLMTSECAMIQFLVQGQVKDATNNAPVPGVKLKATQMQGGTEKVTEVDADGSGIFSVTLGPGPVTLETIKDGFIGATKPMFLSGNVGVGSGADISVSPTLPPDGWRMVLKWDKKPFDLDSHMYFGPYGTMCHMYWAKTRVTCKTGASSILDVDDTNGYGPETTTLKNVGKCSGPATDCKMNFVIHNYSRNPDLASSGAVVTLYNGDREVGKYKAGVDGFIEGDMWHVFTLDDPSGAVEPASLLHFNHRHREHHNLLANAPKKH